jgi:hypothetical protein
MNLKISAKGSRGHTGEFGKFGNRYFTSEILYDIRIDLVHALRIPLFETIGVSGTCQGFQIIGVREHIQDVEQFQNTGESI